MQAAHLAHLEHFMGEREKATKAVELLEEKAAASAKLLGDELRCSIEHDSFSL